MDFFINYWYIIVAALAVVVFIVVACIKFFKLPTKEQIAAFKEWLKLAVTQAEAQLGSKTGQLKLRYVYDLAVGKFPWITKIVSFETFSSWVDEALDWLDEQIVSNEVVAAMVKHTEFTEETTVE